MQQAQILSVDLTAGLVSRTSPLMPTVRFEGAAHPSTLAAMVGRARTVCTTSISTRPAVPARSATAAQVGAERFVATGDRQLPIARRSIYGS